jgi:Tol biopolymer transport system component
MIDESEKGQATPVAEERYVLTLGQGHGIPLAWSADSQYLAVLDPSDVIHYWDVSTRDEQASLGFAQDNYNAVISFAPDLRHLVTVGSDGTIAIWEADASESQLELEPAIIDTVSLAWSTDGKYIASGDKNGEIIIWDAQTGELVQKLTGSLGSVWDLDWSPNSRILASVGDDSFLRLWDITNGQPWLSFSGLEEGARKVQWSADGQHLLTIGGNGVLHVWDTLNNGTIAFSERKKERILDAEWSPDSRLLAISGDDGAIQFTDGDTFETIVVYSGLSGILSWSPDGTKLAASGDPLKLFDVAALTNPPITVGSLPATAPAPAVMLVTPEPTNTPRPTETPSPTHTPRPTQTSSPTYTPEPTSTPEPTATPSPTANASAIIKWQEIDLPPEYLAIHPESIGVEKGATAREVFDPNTEIEVLPIENSFAFANEDGTSFIFGYTYLLVENFHHDSINAQLLVMKENIEDAFPPESSATHIETPVIGQATGGVSMLLSPEERIDSVEFLIDDVGAIVMVRYPEGREPPVDVVKLAQVYAESLVDPQPRCAIDSITPVEESDWPEFAFEASGFFPREQRIVIMEGNLHVGDEIQPAMTGKMGQTGETTDKEGRVKENIVFGPMTDEDGDVYPFSDLILTVIGGFSGCTVSEPVTWPGP